MKHLDLIGVNTEWRATLRCLLYYSQGTNRVWHLDGYDKLKPYGFEIHGCIDGYSRPVLWLSILQSNKDPTEMCNPYFHYLLIAKRVSQKIVVDWGTENVNIAVSQRFLRRNYSDNSSQYQSFQFGKSITNRGIESFWSQLRRSCTDSWIRFFKEIVHGGVYDNSDSLQVECFKFCYFSLIQKELIDIKDCWNNHPIPSMSTVRQGSKTNRSTRFFLFCSGHFQWIPSEIWQSRYLFVWRGDLYRWKEYILYLFYEFSVLSMNEYGRRTWGRRTYRSFAVISRKLVTGRRCLTLVINESCETSHWEF